MSAKRSRSAVPQSWWKGWRCVVEGEMCCGRGKVCGERVEVCVKECGVWER